MNALRNAAYRHLGVERIAGSLGAEVTGVDLAPEVAPDVLAEIRQALLDHQVIFFRDQALSPAQLLAFARRWGDIHLHPFMQGMEDLPEVLEIRKTPADKVNFGGSWHSDQMFAPQPAMATLLYAKQVPEAGGDTMFASHYLAYESLSSGMRAMLDPLRAVSYGSQIGHDGATRQDFFAGKLAMKMKDPGNVQTTSVHPLVRTHPETGRRGLFLGGHLKHFEDMTVAESQPLIDFLMRHSTRPEFTCRFRWKTGSVAFWDNRCTQHFAVNDYHSETRVMHRVTICGDTPY